MALGAGRAGIERMVVERALGLGGAGVLLGVAGGLAVSRLLRSLLFGVSATDPAVFVGASLFLLVILALAGYVPARQRARVDPPRRPEKRVTWRDILIRRVEIHLDAFSTGHYDYLGLVLRFAQEPGGLLRAESD